MDEPTTQPTTDGRDVLGRMLHERQVVRARCIKCGHPDQFAAQEHMGRIVFNACRKCKTYNWEFLGPDMFGALSGERTRLDKLMGAPRPEVFLKSELWLRFCHLLDSHRVQAADGSLVEQWCVGCVNEPHPDGVCGCGCHPAWEFRHRMERAGEDGA